MSNVAESDPVTAQIAWVLSQTPSEVGWRLRPEQELASRMGVGLRQIRKSFNELVEQGVLVRRRGSGTYVQRIPTVSEPAKQVASVSPEVLFVDAEGLTKTDKQRRALHLGLWSDLSYMQHPNQEILAAMVNRAEELGHYLTVHSIVQTGHQALPTTELKHRIEAVPEDGCIVNHWWAEQFLEAAGEQARPILFYRTSSSVIRHQPLVMFNTDEAIERAAVLLHEQGCNSLGFLGQIRQKERESWIFEGACRQLGMGFTKGQFLDFLSPGELVDTGRELLEAGVDGIYVADDHLLPGLVQTMDKMDRVPGRDVSLIVLSNQGVPLPRGHQWSRLEFSPQQLGQVLVDRLIQVIERAGHDVSSEALHATWRPGRTHLRN